MDKQRGAAIHQRRKQAAIAGMEAMSMLSSRKRIGIKGDNDEGICIGKSRTAYI